MKHIVRVRYVLLVIMLISTHVGQCQAAGSRKALVVGIGAYDGNVLPNAGADAADISIALKTLGFETIYARETTRAQLMKALEDFAASLSGAQVGLFYFAGHAVQLRGHNYLLPLGTQIVGLSDVPREAVDLNAVFSSMSQSSVRTRIIFLDACRANPFPQSFMSGLPTSQDWVPGLAQPSDLPAGTVIGFATSLGKTASDGRGEHSPYTRAILDFIYEPGLPFNEFLDDVHNEVLRANAPQQPAVYGSLPADFYFRAPVNVLASYDSGDDEVYLMIDGIERLVWSRDLTTARQIPLHAGDNTFRVDVYNQHTKTGGLFPVAEGWNYTLHIKSDVSNALRLDTGITTLNLELGDKEEIPVMDGPHHGKRFSVASGTLFVDPHSGRISVTNLQTNLAWK